MEMNRNIQKRKELWRLTWSLAKNDFKSKYASSQLGVFWAFFKNPTHKSKKKNPKNLPFPIFVVKERKKRRLGFGEF